MKQKFMMLILMMILLTVLLVPELKPYFSHNMLTVKDIECTEDTDSWLFQCKYRCPTIPSLSPLDFNEINPLQYIPICTNGTVLLAEVTINRPTLPVFSLHDKCLSLVIDKFCYDDSPVPNIVHFVWFGKSEMNFYHYLSFYSAYKFVKPCLILIHADYLPYGQYWERLLTVVSNLIHVKRTAPKTIFGKKVPFVEHMADIARLQAVKELGGIYLDTDEVILKPLDKFRVYNFTLADTRYSNPKDAHFSNAVIFSRKNATFVNLWIDKYKEYNSSIWGYNSVIMPYLLSQNHSDLVHVVDYYDFLIPKLQDSVAKIMFEINSNWSSNYGIHIYKRYTKIKPTFESIRNWNVTIGSVSRYVLLGTRQLCL